MYEIACGVVLGCALVLMLMVGTYERKTRKWEKG